MVASAVHEAHVASSFAGQPFASPAARVEVVTGDMAKTNSRKKMAVVEPSRVLKLSGMWRDPASVDMFT